MAIVKKLAIFLVLCTSMVHAQTYLRVPSSGVQWLAQAKVIKPLAKATPIHFIVWLKLRNKEQFDQLVQDLYDPHSQHYQQFLTPGTFDKYYAPTPDTEHAVQQYFVAQGMQAEIVNHSIRVTASAEQVERTLQTQLAYYAYQGKTVYANNSAPVLPADIAHYVLEITGLDNIKHFQPTVIRPRAALTPATEPQPLSFAWKTFSPQAQPTTRSLEGFSGADLRTAYKIADIAPVGGTKIDGTGQTIVIIDACGTHSPREIMADANIYNRVNHLPLFSSTNFTVIGPQGGAPRCRVFNPGWNEEINLDTQSAHTIADGAQIALVLAPSETDLLSTVSDVVNELINNNYSIGGFGNAYVVSNSWSELEPTGYDAVVETHLEIAAAHGISFNFSTGDCGDNTYTSSRCTDPVSQPTVNYPASSAFVTAVGGTSMFVDKNWQYAFEGLWGTYSAGGFLYGGGGGISQIVPLTAWQNVISGFTAGGYSGTVGSHNKRSIPDIAMLADPTTGLTISFDGQPTVLGGTSLSCPLFSATLTLVNQARALNGGVPHPIGQAAPYLYIFNSTLLNSRVLNRIAPPHLIISGATLPPTGAPLSAFTLEASGIPTTFSWDSSVTIAPENQFWNDGVGLGSPQIPNFVSVMATL